MDNTVLDYSITTENTDARSLLHMAGQPVAKTPGMAPGQKPWLRSIF